MVVSIKGALSEVGLTTSPLNGTSVLGAATAPGAKLDLHGSLGEGVGAGQARVLKSADSGAVNGPDETLLCPVQGVGVEGVEGVVDVEVGATVVC